VDQPTNIEIIAGGIVAGIVALVAVLKKTGAKLFTPNLTSDISDIKITVSMINKVVSEMAVQDVRFDERLLALDRRMTALEKKNG
jgi:hypothetical protein